MLCSLTQCMKFTPQRVCGFTCGVRIPCLCMRRVLNGKRWAPTLLWDQHADGMLVNIYVNVCGGEHRSIIWATVCQLSLCCKGKYGSRTPCGKEMGKDSFQAQGSSLHSKEERVGMCDGPTLFSVQSIRESTKFCWVSDVNHPTLLPFFLLGSLHATQPFRTYCLDTENNDLIWIKTTVPSIWESKLSLRFPSYKNLSSPFHISTLNHHHPTSSLLMLSKPRARRKASKICIRAGGSKKTTWRLHPHN